MVISEWNRRIISFAFALALVAASFPVFAQEEAASSLPAEESESAPEQIQEQTPPPASSVYKTEKLIGDQSFNDFVLGPGKIELTLSPGESRTISLNVANRYTEEKVFAFDIEDMGPSRDPDRAVMLLGNDRGPYSLRDYITIPVTSFTLQPGTRATVPITVTIPADAEPGGLYGSVLANTVTRPGEKTSEENPAGRSPIVSRIGSLFFITVPGEAEVSGQLNEFAVVGNKKFFEKGPINFGITFENTGSVHLNPYGEIRVTNMMGEEVGFQELEPWFVMPKSVRLREISWNRDMLYGKYTATLKLNRGFENQVDEATVTFWVIPWKLIVLGLFALFIVFFLIRSFFSRFEFKRRDA